MEWIYTSNEIVLVKIIPGDGNCLFAALTNQLNPGDATTYAHRERAQSLRQEVVSYIRRNVHVYTYTILQTIQDINQELAALSQEEQIRIQLRNLATDGYWGGEEVIAAYAEMARKCIVIYQEGGNSIVYKEAYENNGILRLAYRYAKGSVTRRNHYDSVQKVLNAVGRHYQVEDRLEAMANHQKINGYEMVDTTPEILETTASRSIGHQQNIKIATWNVRGCSNPKKRGQIDKVLQEINIDIACLQETRMTSGTSVTEQFAWHHCGKRNADSTSRGVAILVRQSANIRLLGFQEHSENICEGIFEACETHFRIITAHIPTDKRLYKVFKELCTVISRPNKENLIIMGDFNAHLGKEDINNKEKSYIGSQLHHHTSNENGRELINILHLFNLRVKSTWAKSKTVLTTWSNGTSNSQLDHILMSDSEEISLRNIRACWSKDVSTDHKILLATMTFTEERGRSPITKRHHRETKLKWNLKRLKCEQENREYKEELGKQLQTIPLQDKLNTEKYNERIVNGIQIAASKTLQRPTSPLPPDVMTAIHRHKTALDRKGKSPYDRALILDLKKATEEKNKALRDHEAAVCANFFNNIEDFHPAQRLHKTYKFLKKHRRDAENRGRSFIPMCHWEREISDNGENQLIEVNETTYWPLNPPPTTEDIAAYCRELKNGKAPGLDRISVELIKEGTEEMARDIESLVALVWMTNRVPKSWTETIQIPIPKVRYPKTTDDYRRITLCNTIYKIYTKHLTRTLTDIMEELPYYQAAFIKDRSTDDHMFTVRRVLEEKWRGGHKLYILSLDLAKAFDSVNSALIPVILKHSAVPGWLTNRIITTCLTEETSILWYGQRTSTRRRGKGVKQGCPLSPKLFNLVLHEVLITLIELLPHFSLGLHNDRMPCILAYADDLIVLAETEEELASFLTEIIPLLKSTGLDLNLKKSSILIRDPSIQIMDRQHNIMKIGDYELQWTRKMKYLGTYITDTLNRPETVAERIKKAHQGTRILLPFIKKFKFPWTLTKIIYHSIIVPIAIYGIPVAVTTKANRTRLKHMERKIIALLQLSNAADDKTAVQLLENRTILKTLIIRRLRYWGHILRREPGHILQVAKNMEMVGPKKIGRPCFTWNTTLEEDIRKTGKTEIWWKQAARNKQLLKTKTKEIYDYNISSDSEEMEDSD